MYAHCRLTTSAREYAIKEIFRRGLATALYQRSLFFFSLQQGQTLPSSATIYSMGRNKLKEYVKTLFGQELLTELLEDFESHRIIVDNFAGSAFSSDPSEKAKHQNALIQEMKSASERKEKRKK